MSNVKVGSKVKRHGDIYDVVDVSSNTNEICVLLEIRYFNPPFKRMTKVWWNLNQVEVL